jgi:AcrR family transcriptional regulator
MSRQKKIPGVRRLTGSARRTQLIEIARTVFAQRGYEATSVEEIAARAKVSKPIVYEHFGGKEGLYAVLVDREMEHVVSLISEAITSGTPRQRVESAALAFLTYVRDQPDGFVVLSRDAPVTLARGGMSSLLNDVAERVANVFTTTFKKAGYNPKAAPIYAHALVGMVTFVGQWWTETRKPPVEEVAGHLAALSWMGLRHLPKRPKLTATPKA